MKFTNFLTILTVVVTLASASPFPDQAKYAKALGVIESRGDGTDSEPKYQRFEECMRKHSFFQVVRVCMSISDKTCMAC
ncbi:hypothetical protein L207DRAFT_576420 [Hyaloscypha variabilis F]|uniref:ShKT domain-containing protein n=1 Tax=Hyaloscypha variabilis (strain UAMH 11265 / GT02V1 / F) TaxID=1149755 RepID=A0A2J6SA66_HYAVF|nr:hypothetical protein L207DRAFT_576420 [Hyaloscypha variabilis F]